LHLAMSKNYSTYQLGHFSAWQTMKIFSHGFLWKNLSIELSRIPFCSIKKNSPEGYHLYWFNTMKPINLPPSLSTGHATIVPLLLCNLWENNFQNFRVLTSQCIEYSTVSGALLSILKLCSMPSCWYGILWLLYSNCIVYTIVFVLQLPREGNLALALFLVVAQGMVGISFGK